MNSNFDANLFTKFPINTHFQVSKLNKAPTVEMIHSLTPNVLIAH